MKLTEKEQKTVINAFENTYGYCIRELTERSTIIAEIMRKIGIDVKG